jgi:hypothetical protein
MVLFQQQDMLAEREFLLRYPNLLLNFYILLSGYMAELVLGFVVV